MLTATDELRPKAGEQASVSAPLAFEPFLGFQLTTATTAEFQDWLIAECRDSQSPTTVSYLNAAMVNLAYQSPEHAANLRAMNALYADGQSVVWGANARGVGVPERVNAGDFTRELMVKLAECKLKLALVGGRPPTNAKVGESMETPLGEADRAARRFFDWAPNLDIVYTHHGYFREDSDEEDAVYNALDATSPDLVLMGMGAPRQERLAVRWVSRVGAKPRTYWCVGALFEYYCGARQRAPQWMRKAGLEWVVRLALEPTRLWKRYLVGNPQFVYRVIRGRAPNPTTSPPANRLD